MTFSIKNLNNGEKRYCALKKNHVKAQVQYYSDIRKQRIPGFKYVFVDQKCKKTFIIYLLLYNSNNLKEKRIFLIKSELKSDI